MNQSGISVDLTNGITNKSTILSRATKIELLFQEANGINTVEHEVFLSYVARLIGSIENNKKIEWFYKGVEGAINNRFMSNTRSNIFDYISRRGPVSRKQISSFFEKPERTISYHLKALIDEKKIQPNTNTKYNMNVKYVVNDEYIKQLEESKSRPRIFYGKEEPKEAKNGDLWFKEID